MNAELGHWKLGHTPINFTMGQLIMLANFMLFAAVRNTPGLYESFGFTQDRPALVAFFLFQFLLGPLDEVRAVICRCIVVHEDTAAAAACNAHACLSCRMRRSAQNVSRWSINAHGGRPPPTV